MKDNSKKFLFKLLKTPSPTGYEENIQKEVKKYISDSADKISKDVHGNLIACINPKAKLKVMLAGHCDQIGFQVRSVNKAGYVYFNALGGIDTAVMLGTKITILSKKGPVTGVIGRKPIHLQSGAEREKAKVSMKTAWLDIGAKDQKEALKHISIGDPAVYQPVVTELLNGNITAPGLDDRAGLYVAIEVLKECAKIKKKLKVGVYSVSTVQEEVGLRGAQTASYQIEPDIGIAIDLTFGTDDPSNPDQNATPIKLGNGGTIQLGPFSNPVLSKKIRDAAKKYKIPCQIETTKGRGGTDAIAMQVSKKGVAATTMSIPSRYMHTQAEVVNLKDLDSLVKLICKVYK